MNKAKSIKSQISLSAILCFVVGMLIVLLTVFFYLRAAFQSQAEQTLKEQGEKYGNLIRAEFERPISFLSGVSSMIEAQIKSGDTDRVALQQDVMRAFEKYTVSEGTALMFEPNAYDGLDSEYVDSEYGTVYTGRVSYYYWREDGQVRYLPQTEDDELEFVQPYYLTSREKKVPTYSEPYEYPVADRVDYMITASYPLLSDANEVLGIMTVDLYLESMHASLRDEVIYDTGYIVVTSEDGMILYSPDIDTVGSYASEFGLDYQRPGAGDGGVSFSTVRSHLTGKSSLCATVPVELEQADGLFYISVVAPKIEVNAAFTRLLVIMGVISVLVGAAIVIAVRGVLGRILQPMNTMQRILGKVGASGDLNISGEEWVEARAAAERDDEIGRSMAAVNRILEQFVSYGRCLQTVAEHDLTVTVDTLSDQDTCGVALRDMVATLNNMFGEITAAANQVSAASQQIDHASQTLASGSSEQASAIQQLSATITGLREIADENAATATETLADVQASGEAMHDCIEAMDQMLSAMQDIDQKSQAISKVIKVIDDIAFQTNILALNAAVEAARAGQHGKGFAVVADEVRNLASKSADAARETADLIAGSSRSVAEGNQIVARVSDSLRSVGEITASIQQLSAVVQANSATAEETAAAAEEMSSQAALLDEIIRQFRLGNTAPGTQPPHNTGYEQGFSLN